MAAAAFARTCSAWAAFGMTMIPGRRGGRRAPPAPGRRRAARRPRPAPSSAAAARPGRGGCRPSPGCRALRTRAAGRTRCRVPRGCRAPGWWRRPPRARALSMSSRSKLETPQERIFPSARSARTRPRSRPRASPAPVQQVEVEPVGPSRSRLRSQAALVPRARRVLGQDLADQEDLVPAPRDRLGDHALGAARAVHLGGVDQGHAEVEAEAERSCFRRRLPPALAHVPGALAERRDGGAVGERAGLIRPRRQRSAARSARRKLPPQSEATAARHSRGAAARR